MFCMRCGKPLPDGAKFCAHCGTPQKATSTTKPSSSVININQSTRLVPCTCTNCASSLQVDPNQKAAICPACGTTFIVQQAINNFNIHSTGNIRIENAVITVPGANADNYVMRAVGLEQQYEMERALEYYNKALDIDARNRDALRSVERITELLDDYCYKTGPANVLFVFGKLMLKKNKLIFVSDNGKVATYDLSAITDIKISKGCLEFVYGGNKDCPVSYGGENIDAWVAVLTNAKEGNYPPITEETIVLQPHYATYYRKLIQFLSTMGKPDVTDSFSSKRYSVMLKDFGNYKMGVINVYKDYKSCSLNEAMEFVESIPGIITTTASKDEANAVSRIFEEAGAIVEIRDDVSVYRIEPNNSTSVGSANTYPTSSMTPNMARPSSNHGIPIKLFVIVGIVGIIYLIFAMRSCFFGSESHRQGPDSVGVYDSSLLQKGEEIVLDSEHTISDASFKAPQTWRYRETDKYQYFYPKSDDTHVFLMVFSQQTGDSVMKESFLDEYIDYREEDLNDTPKVIKREIEHNGDFYIARLNYKQALKGVSCEFVEFIILDSKTKTLYFFTFISEDYISDENLIYFNEITRSIEL